MMTTRGGCGRCYDGTTDSAATSAAAEVAAAAAVLASSWDNNCQLPQLQH